MTGPLTKTSWYAAFNSIEWIPMVEEAFDVKCVEALSIPLNGFELEKFSKGEWYWNFQFH